MPSHAGRPIWHVALRGGDTHAGHCTRSGSEAKPGCRRRCLTGRAACGGTLTPRPPLPGAGDTLTPRLDPALLGYHIDEAAGLTTEVIARHLEDRGGGLARVNGRLRLVEGMALPREEIESQLSYYNSATYWVNVDRLLAVMALARGDLANQEKLVEATRRLAARMPSYITLKDVKKRWGKGQEDVFPVAQFEKLWGDITSLADLSCRYVVVPRVRGQQLKEPAQLDAWLRDGSAAHIERLCGWHA